MNISIPDLIVAALLYVSVKNDETKILCCVRLCLMQPFRISSAILCLEGPRIRMLGPRAVCNMCVP
jgi:hypothetical protein